MSKGAHHKELVTQLTFLKASRPIWAILRKKINPLNCFDWSKKYECVSIDVPRWCCEKNVNLWWSTKRNTTITIMVNGELEAGLIWVACFTVVTSTKKTEDYRYEQHYCDGANTDVKKTIYHLKMTDVQTHNNSCMFPGPQQDWWYLVRGEELYQQHKPAIDIFVLINKQSFSFVALKLQK